MVDFRPISAGMGQAVAERTVLRKKTDGTRENWGDVAARVASGNVGLVAKGDYDPFLRDEMADLAAHIAQGRTIMSGRHLQHGDENQSQRNMEVFTNCATAATSFLQFYLMLNGSGVGRCYDDDMMLVDWNNAPVIHCVLDEAHPDFQWGVHESRRDAAHKYVSGTRCVWHTVGDSREGWAQALELWESLAFHGEAWHKTLVLDFSQVRPAGRPIAGMQNRPSSGPASLMAAFHKAGSIKGAGMPRWMQAMYVDHYFAECVLVGGARRAARMSTKIWTDPTVLDFIAVKRPVEYLHRTMAEVLEYRKTNQPLSFLWTSNNSVAVDSEFWEQAIIPGTWAAKVFDAVCEASYADGTGEPGFINANKLVQKDDGWEGVEDGDFIGGKKYRVNDFTRPYLGSLAKAAKAKTYHTIVNPCGEIPLNVLGGFCVIGDVVPFHCDNLDQAEDCFRAVTRALIRVNTMPSVYDKEVARTNRIGVGVTGIHEFAWKFFKFGFRDLLDEAKSRPFWRTMARFSRAVHEEAVAYSAELGLAVPHTVTTVKPSGSVSKLFGLTEGWHLPSMGEFLRWVQFRNDDPLVAEYEAAGYPARRLKTYEGTTIIGFPTAPAITQMGMGDALVLAAEATPAEQYQWLNLGEKYWIEGGRSHGEPYGGQISYTLKYDPATVEYEDFRRTMLTWQPLIRCCTVMPQADGSAYEYQPEEPVAKEVFDAIVARISARMEEDAGPEHIACEGGACPVDFNIHGKVAYAAE